MFFRRAPKCNPKSFIRVTFLQIPGPPDEISGLIRGLWLRKRRTKQTWRASLAWMSRRRSIDHRLQLERIQRNPHPGRRHLPVQRSSLNRISSRTRNHRLHAGPVSSPDHGRPRAARVMVSFINVPPTSLAPTLRQAATPIRPHLHPGRLDIGNDGIQHQPGNRVHQQ